MRNKIRLSVVISAVLLLSIGSIFADEIELSNDHTIIPSKNAAVLLSEYNLEISKGKGARWTGGVEVYRAQVNWLKEFLNSAGVPCEIITEKDIFDKKLWNYKILYIINTLAISSDSEAEIRSFVKAGGVLVGIYHVGQFQGGWTENWHFEDIFGLKEKRIGKFSTGDIWNKSLYKKALLAQGHNNDSLVKGLEKTIYFGELSTHVWATEVKNATIIAYYPKYVEWLKEPRWGVYRTENRLTEGIIPAVTVNTYGKGTAIFISTLFTGRKETKIKVTKDVRRLLINSISYTKDKLYPDLTKKKSPQAILSVSHLGYHPYENKFVIVKVDNMDNPNKIKEANFTVYRIKNKNKNNKIKVYEGNLNLLRTNIWNARYWKGDFSSVKEQGSYILEANLKGEGIIFNLRSPVFFIEDKILTNHTLPLQIEFLKKMRCGEDCHLNAEITGGYHDASGDWNKRMWSMPHLVYGLSRYLEYDKSNTEIQKELIRAVKWCLSMLGPDGEVWFGVHSNQKWHLNKIQMSPKDDPTFQGLDKKVVLLYASNYIAAMARASGVLKTVNKGLSQESLNASIKAWNYIKNKKLENTGDLGAYLWGTMELFLATKNSFYLEYAKMLAPKILSRQVLKNYRINDTVISGNFYQDAKRRKFLRPYKMFEYIGLYLGLIELREVLSDRDPLGVEIDNALERFFQKYLLQMSSFSPYGQFAEDIELENKDSVTLYFFTMGRQITAPVPQGLNVDHLAMALVALDYYRLTNSPELLRFASNQVQWVLGQNPLGISMMEGIGKNPPTEYSSAEKIGTGRIIGGIPNGIVGEGIFNKPIWGDFWTSREYWLPTNAYYIAIMPILDSLGN